MPDIHIGVIEEAGFKPKKPPKTGQNFCMKVSGWDRTYYINKEEDRTLQVVAVQLMGKTVKVTYEQSGEYRNISTIEEVAPVPVTEPSTGDRMTKEDWGTKDRRIVRVAIAKSFIECRGQIGLVKEDIANADKWFNWVYEIAPTATTKPQEAKVATRPEFDTLFPPTATKNKPAVIPPEKGAKTLTQLWDELNDFMAKHKWGTAKMRQEVMRLANENKWENAEELSENWKAMDLGQLAHFVAFLNTEIAKTK
jgi:hypothetical protein